MRLALFVLISAVAWGQESGFVRLNGWNVPEHGLVADIVGFAEPNCLIGNLGGANVKLCSSDGGKPALYSFDGVHFFVMTPSGQILATVLSQNTSTVNEFMNGG